MIELLNLLPNPDMSCNSLKGSIHISKEGHVKPCCYFKDLGPHQKYWRIDSNTSNINSLDNIVDSYEWNNFVSPNPSCEYCIIEEANNMYSLRHHWNEKIAPDTNKLQYLELALDFTCNMMCRICGPQQSSRWNSSSVLKNMREEFSMSEDISYTKTKGSKEYTKNIKRILSNSDLSDLKEVTLIGGEPLYSKNLPWFIDLIKQQEHWKDIKITIITNGSLVPKSNMFVGFKEVQIDVSLDAVGDLATATRMKVSWEIIDANIRKMIKLYKVSIHSTVSLLNCNKMQPLIDYFYTLDPLPVDHTFSVLQTPYHQAVTLIPKEYRLQWITSHLKVNNILAMEYHENLDEVCRFLRATEILDAESEIPYRDANPEIVEIMEELVKNYKSDDKYSEINTVVY